MKGKVTCPKCSFKFIVEGEKGVDKEVKCPKCGNKFIVKIGKTREKDVKWIEYGGARKAILPVPEDLSNRPVAAGILLAMSSAVGILTVIMFYLYPKAEIVTPYSFVSGNCVAISTLTITAFSIICAIGSYCALKKTSLIGAIIGSISGVLSFGLLVVSPILSLTALILLLTSRTEFESDIHGKEF
ncbi:MAG: hypothetical protein DRP38_06400 [Thermotogae bacterium]|nr:MAG: hypothetical protein DRP38_06400 [Thermotogota bacterium]